MSQAVYDTSGQRRYFVTGASGFIGHRVCEMLLARRQHVLALARAEAQGLERLGACCLRGDLSRMDSWPQALAGVDVVIHCAANSRFGNGPQYEADNVRTTRNLVEAIRANAPRIGRLVFVSTVGAMDRAGGDRCLLPLTESGPLCPTSDYGRSKAEGESLVRNSGVPFVIVRPALVVGSRMRADSHFAVFARWALGGHPLSRIAWTGRFSVVDVDELAEAIIVCATHPDAAGRVFLCGGDPVELRAYFDSIKPAWRVSLAPVQPLFRAAGSSMPFKLKSMLLPALVVDDGPLRRLGWRPAKSPADRLAPVIQRERARLDPTVDPPFGQTVITGAASGLGRALAERLAAHRTRLLLVDRDGHGLAELALRIPHCRWRIADLADEAACRELVNSPEWNAYPIAELYACAGVGRRGEFARETLEKQIDMMQVNLLARMRLAHAAIADMTRNQFGRIVLIASSSAFQPLPFMSAYAASNAALLAFGEGLAYEVESRGIHVMTVCPGGMQTNFQQTANVKRDPKERLMAPDEVVSAIMQGLARRRTTILVSDRARLMALLARLLPRRLSLKLWGHLMTTLR